MHLGTEGFVSHAKTALQDEPLQEALQLLVHNFAPRRVQAMAALGNPEELRTQARSIKEHTIAHLDIYLEQFATQLDRLGVHVHWADDAAEARQIITSIAQAAEAKVVVKGKSMATEEIELNPHLEQHGFEVVETDLGEYIIQLAKESPSHIIAPAIHKTRRQIAELFHEKLQAPYTDEITEMTQLARRQLRQQFLRADVGITGVNFAIAETGSIVIVTNEGNGRLSSTLPKVHVALMGMEKLIPRLSDLSVMLKVLTNSATGQKISSYVTMMTGPRRAHDLDGPEALHVVMMDNGRSSILRSANREALYCLRCGACLNVCPIYQNIGGHAYGWVYPGPIGAVLTPLFVGLEPAHHLPRASTLCGACRDACPVKINIPHLLLNLRQELVEQRYVHWSEVWLFKLWARLMQHPRFYTWATRLAGWMQKPLARQGWIGKLPPPFHGWTQTRDFKAAAPVSFRRRWQQTLQHERAAPSGRGRDGYSQEAFLVRVRRALQSEPGPAPPAAPEPVLSETAETLRARLQAQRQQLVARLQEELSAVGGKVVRVQSVAEATQYVTQLALDLKASLIVRWQSEVLDALEIDASLEQAGIDLHLAAPPQVDASEPEIDAKRQEVRERLARAEIGLSGVDYAIAETGTLALSALPGQMRGVSLLPPVHVAVASSEQIVATLADCLALFQAEGPSLPERLSSCVSFITGPSRTGDIELSLTIGVHGPGELHLVILDGPEVAGRQEGS